MALHPCVSVTVFKFHRTRWQLNWETKCSVLLALNGGILLNVSWNDPKHARKKKTKPVSSASTAAHLCSCVPRVPVFRVVFADALWPVDVRKEADEQASVLLAAVGWLGGVHFKTCASTLKMADGDAPVTRLAYVNCPSVGARKPLYFLLTGK